MDEKPEPCPTCGRCPTCGESPRDQAPVIVPQPYPYPVYPNYPQWPYWSQTTCTGGTIYATGDIPFEQTFTVNN